MASSTIRKVLVLHGYSQNATIISKRIAAIRKQAKGFEFVFVNAPHILQPAEMFGAADRFDSVVEGPSIADVQKDPETAMRGWWKANAERTKVWGLEESLASIREVLQQHQFVGVFGFSQGAAFAGLLSALLEKPHIYPPFLVNGESPHPPFEFCVAVSGFKVFDPAYSSFYEGGYSTPTLHVIGKTDVVVIEERSQMLVKVSKAARVETHAGGHFVPSVSHWRKFFVEYMKDPLATLRSPKDDLEPLKL